MPQIFPCTAAAIAALALPVAALALPSTVRYDSMVIALQETDWTDTLSLQQYAGNGLLTGVTVEFFGNLAGDIMVESTDLKSSTLTVSLSSTLVLSLPTAGVSELRVTPTYSQTFGATAFDGKLNFAGTSGTTFTVADTAPVTAAASVSFSDAANLALFTGPGLLTLSVSTTDRSATSGSGNFADGYASLAGAYAHVTYTYQSAPVPEPGTWALMLAGLGMFGHLAARRKGR